MIKTLRTGILIKVHQHFRCRILKSEHGVTLLELIVVITIVGVILAVTFARISLTHDISLTRKARQFASLIRYLNEAAITKKLHYRVWFNLDKEQVRVESSIDGIEYKDEPEVPLRGLALRGGEEIEDIVLLGLGRINKGEVTVIFSPSGFSEPFNLHLKGAERFLTLIFNPYTGRVKIKEGYV